MNAHDDVITRRLVTELELMRDDPAVPDLISFAVDPWSAFVLVAALQGASRNPSLSDQQVDVVIAAAHQIADRIVGIARPKLGPGSAVETVLALGFDVTYDRPFTERR